MISNEREFRETIVKSIDRLNFVAEDYHQLANYYATKEGSWVLTEKSYRDQRLEIIRLVNQLKNEL